MILLLLLISSLILTGTGDPCLRPVGDSSIRNLFIGAGKLLKIPKTLFYIPGPFEDEDTATPFDAVTNKTAAAVNTTVQSFWTPFFSNVIASKIDHKIEAVEAKTNMTEV
eukprot:GHVN01067722.1.p1 GENE.GHVN01067722.1~~GHVN01067722.1.p1  ORF type:complete len:110 (-),score=11.05 GHVN01067722.1:489-818(-)